MTRRKTDSDIVCHIPGLKGSGIFFCRFVNVKFEDKFLTEKPARRYTISYVSVQKGNVAYC